jgi:hypothetical protein
VGAVKFITPPKSLALHCESITLDTDTIPPETCELFEKLSREKDIPVTFYPKDMVLEEEVVELSTEQD